MKVSLLNNSLSWVALSVYQLRWVLLTCLLVLLGTLTVINQKVEAITVTGETQWLDQQELKAKVLHDLNSDWFTTSISDIKQTAESIDWVDSVNVKRKWPSELEIDITEQQPIACWNKFALTNKAKLISVDACLPNWLSVSANKDFINAYQLLSPTLEYLETTLQQKLVGIDINERGTWTLQTDNQLFIVAKNDGIESRLVAWIKLIESGSLKVTKQFKKVDLRYPNGFSVKI